MLPTRAQWEAAHASGLAEAAEVPGGAPATTQQVVEVEPPKRSFPRLPRSPGKPPAPGGSNRVKQILSSLAIVVVFLVIFFVAKASNHKHPSTTTSAAATTSATSVPEKSNSATVTPTSATSPSVAKCASAWNGGRSPEHRHALDLTVIHDSSPVATIATYAGPGARLARFGGGSPVLVSQNACIIISHHRLFIEQPDHNWGQVKAFRTYPFAVVAAPGHWAVEHANASIHAGALNSPDSNIGAVTPSKNTLVILTADDIGTPPKRQ
jgi:hypothetical protein